MSTPRFFTSWTIRNLVRLTLVLACLPLGGALGFYWIENWRPLDALYMSIITLTTVGYHEVHPLSDGGRIFVMVYLVVGLGCFLYALAQLGEVIVRTELRAWFWRKRMDKSIQKFEQHYIVCGGGRVGISICAYLAKKNLNFVLIDNDPRTVAECRQKDWYCIEGDATDDDTLTRAGIVRAKGLAAVLGSDADNVYVVLSARMLAETIQIIARASDEKAVVKLTKAGSDRVVSLYQTGASKMAQLLANENLQDFMEILSDDKSELDLAELTVGQEGPFTGKKFSQAKFDQKELVVVAIRKAKGELVLPPQNDTLIEAGDCLIAVGKAMPLAKLTSII